MNVNFPNQSGDRHVSSGEISPDSMEMVVYRMLGKVSQALLNI